MAARVLGKTLRDSSTRPAAPQVTPGAEGLGKATHSRASRAARTHTAGNQPRPCQPRAGKVLTAHSQLRKENCSCPPERQRHERTRPSTSGTTPGPRTPSACRRLLVQFRSSTEDGNSVLRKREGATQLRGQCELTTHYRYGLGMNQLQFHTPHQHPDCATSKRWGTGLGRQPRPRQAVPQVHEIHQLGRKGVLLFANGSQEVLPGRGKF